MPRMHVWLTGLGTCAASSYVGYHYVYLPRTTSQSEFETRLMMDSQQLQHVMQTYAQLRATVEQAKAQAAILARQQGRLPATRHESQTAQTSTRISAPSSTKPEADDSIDYETIVAGGSMPEAESTAISSADGTGQREAEHSVSQSQRPGNTLETGRSEIPESSSSSLDIVSEPIFHTNREKLLFYLQIQRIRWMLYRLPKTAQQTEKDRQEVLRTLDVYEQTYCCTGSGRVVTSTAVCSSPQAAHTDKATAVTKESVVALVSPLAGALNFRDAPLSVGQTFRCLCSVALYMVTFQLLPLLLSMCPHRVQQFVLMDAPQAALASLVSTPDYLVDEHGRRDPDRAAAVLAYRLHNVYHTVACVIVRLLEIEVEMTASEQLYSFSTSFSRGKNETNERIERNDAESGSSTDITPQYIVMNPSHWIEEVGFWACRENPLLLPPSFLPPAHGEGASNAARDRDHLSELGGASAVTLGDSRGSMELRDGTRDLQGYTARYALRVLSAPSASFLMNLLDARTRAWWMGTGPLSTEEDVPLLKREEAKSAGSLLSVATGRFLWESVWRGLGCPLARAFPVGYDVFWRLQQSKKDEADRREWVLLRKRLQAIRGDAGGGPGDGEDTSSEAAAAGTSPNMNHGRSSFGYPLAVDADALATHVAPASEKPAAPRDTEKESHRKGEKRDDRHSVPCFVPVGIAGLPRVLYVDASVARPDRRPRNTSKGVYSYLAHDQFSRSPSSGSDGNTSIGAGAATIEDDMAAFHRGNPSSQSRLVKDKHALSVAGKLDAVQRYRGMPAWSRMWWGGVYGGESRHGRVTRRALYYHMGTLTPVQDLPEAVLDATAKAVEAAYAE